MMVGLTGSSGFLGGYIKNACSTKLITIGRQADQDIVWDFFSPLTSLPQFDVFIHAAGKAHSVPKTETEKNEFFKVNLEATKNILEKLRITPPAQFVFISTVAVYGLDIADNISEVSPIKGITPYAQSKFMAEEAVRQWAIETGTKALILRLPLITGKNPPGNLEAMAKAIKKGYYFRIGAGSAKKSMVSAGDVAQFIFQAKNIGGTFNLTDGIHPAIKEVDEHIAAQFGKQIKTLPAKALAFIAKFGDVIPGFPLTTNRLQKLNSTLTFDDSLARSLAGWNPQPALQQLTFTKNP